MIRRRTLCSFSIVRPPLPHPATQPGAVIESVAKRRHEQLRLKPVITNWLGESTARAARALFAEANIATYDFPQDAVRAFIHRRDHARALAALMRTPPSLPQDFTVDADAARRAMAAAKQAGRAVLTEPEAKRVLAAYSIAVARTEIVRDAAEVEASPRACCTTSTRSP
jgi:acetyltransferase